MAVLAWDCLLICFINRSSHLHNHTYDAQEEAQLSHINAGSVLSNGLIGVAQESMQKVLGGSLVMRGVNISIWTARPNGTGVHVLSHTLIGDAERESAFHQEPYLLFHPPPLLSCTGLLLSIFPLLQPPSFISFLLQSYFMLSPSFSVPLCCLTCRLFNFQHPLIFPPVTFLLTKSSWSGFHFRLCLLK